MRKSEEQCGLWLIQRGKFRKIEKSRISGFDSLIQLDYMGSAEFEFGTVPMAFRRIMKDYQNYSFIEIPEITTTDGFPMYVLHNEHDTEIILKRCEYLSTHKYGYKEFCDIETYMSESRNDYTNNFWWDVEHDFMIVFGPIHKNRLEIAMNESHKIYLKNRI